MKQLSRMIIERPDKGDIAVMLEERKELHHLEEKLDRLIDKAQYPGTRERRFIQ